MDLTVRLQNSDLCTNQIYTHPPPHTQARSTCKKAIGKCNFWSCAYIHSCDVINFIVSINIMFWLRLNQCSFEARNLFVAYHTIFVTISLLMVVFLQNKSLAGRDGRKKVVIIDADVNDSLYTRQVSEWIMSSQSNQQSISWQFELSKLCFHRDWCCCCWDQLTLVMTTPPF